MKTDSILGLNARNRLYLVYNSKRGRRLVDSKLLTKKLLKVANLPTPQVLAVFKNPKQVFDFNWLSLPDNFVLKPCSGFGGQGVLVVKKKAKWAGEWRLMDDSLISINDLRLWALNILAGEYSLHNLTDFAFVEERIKIRKIFWSYAYQGTPDIRVLVFNKVPVMAMLRLPTPESQGKANLHQGAIGVGIDIATGITGFGICRGKIIKEIPWTKRKVNGFKIPFWNNILTLAVRCQEKIPELGFAGVDIVLDKDRGPMVLEINARPGLEIQNANLIPLKKRLERVEGLEVVNAEHGVRIAKALFAGRYADRIMAQEGLKILKTSEEVKIISLGRKALPVMARIDTGAFRSSIDKGLAKKLGLLKKTNILWKEGEKYAYRSAQGRQSRSIIAFNYWLAGRKIKSSASVADRSKMKHPALVGRNDLGGFLVRP